MSKSADWHHRYVVDHLTKNLSFFQYLRVSLRPHCPFKYFCATGFPVRGRLSLSASVRGEASGREALVGLADPDWAYFTQASSMKNYLNNYFIFLQCPII